MKMKLSKYWWKILYAMITLGIVLEIYMTYVYIKTSSQDFEWFLVMTFCILCMCSIVPILSKRYLMTMEIYDKVIKSLFFGRLKCEVYTDKEIYYAIFKCKEGNSWTREYIAISNETFVCEQKKPTIWSQNTYIDCYDTTKQIIFPYDNTTKHLFDIEEWIRVN